MDTLCRLGQKLLNEELSALIIKQTTSIILE